MASAWPSCAHPRSVLTFFLLLSCGFWGSCVRRASPPSKSSPPSPRQKGRLWRTTAEVGLGSRRFSESRLTRGRLDRVPGRRELPALPLGLLASWKWPRSKGVSLNVAKEGEAISGQMFCRDVFTGKPEASAGGTEHARALVPGPGSSEESLSLFRPSRRRDSCRHHSSRMSQGQRGRP